jgi:hypothetical protein
MSVSTVVTLGYGSFGSASATVTLGYSIAEPPPVPGFITAKIGGGVRMSGASFGGTRVGSKISGGTRITSKTN